MGSKGSTPDVKFRVYSTLPPWAWWFYFWKEYDFSPHYHIQKNSETHPASYLMAMEVPLKWSLENLQWLDDSAPSRNKVFVCATISQTALKPMVRRGSLSWYGTLPPQAGRLWILWEQESSLLPYPEHIWDPVCLIEWASEALPLKLKQLKHKHSPPCSDEVYKNVLSFTSTPRFIAWAQG